MPNFHALLNLRLRSKESQKPKMNALAERSNAGNLSSFSGIFKVSALNDTEKETLSSILNNYKKSEEASIENDLQSLSSITAEVKAITNQAVILHGERIKKAQEILKNYQDGAFTAWLLTTYGNRQTPYNFLQYYEFYTSLAPELQSRIDDMPRQAIYTLASRNGPQDRKEEIIKNYQGQNKRDLLLLIRNNFPLDESDKRQANISAQILALLKKAKTLAKNLPHKTNNTEIASLIDEIMTIMAKGN